MTRKHLATTLVFLLMASSAIAGLGSASGYNPISHPNSAVAPVWVEGEGLFNLASIYYWKGSLEEISVAEQYTQEAVRLAELTGDQRTVARSLTSLGLLAQTRGEVQEADRKFEESLQISRPEGYKDIISEDLRWLGAQAGWQGNYQRAVALLTGCAESRTQR